VDEKEYLVYDGGEIVKLDMKGRAILYPERVDTIPLILMNPVVEDRDGQSMAVNTFPDSRILNLLETNLPLFKRMLHDLGEKIPQEALMNSHVKTTREKMGKKLKKSKKQK
jgi:hypothetical protein